ncbi:MAG: hypothetical protein U0936_23470 [Planctomycetaceae bacterium]
MQQFVAFAIASAVLFTAGLIAGQGVNQSDDTVVASVTVEDVATADAAPEDFAGNAPADASDEVVEKPMPSPIMNASHQRQEEVTDRYFSSVDAAAEADKASEIALKQDAESSPVTAAADPARRQLSCSFDECFPMRNLKRFLFGPKPTKEWISWEVEFILEQKRAMSGSLDSEIATAMLGTPIRGAFTRRASVFANTEPDCRSPERDSREPAGRMVFRVSTHGCDS